MKQEVADNELLLRQADLDFVVDDAGAVGGGRDDDGEVGREAGFDLEGAAVEGAFDFVALDFAIGERGFFVRAEVAERVKVTFEVDKYDGDVFWSDLNVLKLARRDVGGVGNDVEVEFAVVDIAAGTHGSL